MDLLESIFTGIFIAIISSWVTVQLSLRKFQKEKIWERKFKAYLKIIEALHHIKDYIGREEEFEIGMRDRERISNEELSRVFSQYRTAHEELVKYINISELIISREAVQLLNEYIKSTSADAACYMDEINMIWNATSSCLTKLIPVAKEDLRFK